MKIHHWVWWLMTVILALGVGMGAEMGGVSSVRASLGDTVLSAAWDIV